MNRRVGLLVMALIGIGVWAACGARSFGQVAFGQVAFVQVAFGQVEKRISDVLIERAAGKMEEAALPNTTPATRARLRDKARDLYRKAEKRLVARRDRIRNEWLDELTRADRTQQATAAARKRMVSELVRIDLLSPVVAYEISTTYEPGSAESKEALTMAAERFADLSRSDGLSPSLDSWYARLWLGRCYRDLGQFDDAFEAFTRIDMLEDDLPAFRTLKHRAMIAHLETCMMPELNNYAKAAKDARIWIDWTPKDQHSAPGGLGIKYLGAEAMLKCIAAGEAPEAKRPETFRLARRFLLDVSKRPGEYQTTAKDRLAGKDFAELLQRYPPKETEDEPLKPNQAEHESHGDQGAKTGARPRILVELEEATTSLPEVKERLRERNRSWGVGFDSKRALAEANAAVRDNPNSAEAHRRRAWVKTSVKDHHGALKDVNVAIELDPACANSLVCRGLINGRLQRHDEARKDFDRVLEIDPTDCSALAFRGKTNLLLGDLDAAIEDCYIAARVEPWSWDTRLTLAEAYFKKGDVDNAMSCVDLTISLMSEDHVAYRLRASFLAAQGKTQQAMEDCNKSIELYNVDEETYLLRGGLFAEQGNHGAAIGDYRAAARINPKSTTAHLKRGLVHFLTGNTEEAAKCRDLAVQANPADAHPYRTRGEEMLSKGSRHEAILCFSVSIALNADDPEAHIARGNALKDMGDMEKAAADFRKADELSKGQRGS